MNSHLKVICELDQKSNNTKLIDIHRRRCIEKSICANCLLDVIEIYDDEYLLSALCLNCQNEFFPKDVDE